MRSLFRSTVLFASSLPLLLLASCASTGESAGSDRLTAHVGHYSPPPAGALRPKVGVPAFSVTGKSAKNEMNEVAADQATTLLVNSGRFIIIERAQLDKLLAEQNLSGIVRDGELSAQNNVEGVEYLLIGKVSNFRTKVSKTKTGLGIAKVGLGAFGLGGGDVKNEKVEITTDCGVDLRLVDPSTGRILVSDFSEYKRTDSASAMGVEILGVNATADADMKISDDDYGKILRLALDEAIRKMLPRVDSEIARMAPPPAAGVPVPAASTPTSTTAASVQVAASLAKLTLPSAPAAVKKSTARPCASRCR